MKWEHVLQRFARQAGLGSWTSFACSGFAQKWLELQGDFADFVRNSMGADVADVSDG